MVNIVRQDENGPSRQGRLNINVFSKLADRLITQINKLCLIEKYGAKLLRFYFHWKRTIEPIDISSNKYGYKPMIRVTLRLNKIKLKLNRATQALNRAKLS